MMDQQSITILAKFLNSFSEAAGDADARAAAYLDVCSDIEPAILSETAHRFMAGLVEGANPRFVPSTAEFAIEARKRRDYHELLAKRRATVALPAPVKPEYRAPSTEARERGAALWERVKPTLQGADTGRDLRRKNAAPEPEPANVERIDGIKVQRLGAIEIESASRLMTRMREREKSIYGERSREGDYGS